MNIVLRDLVFERAGRRVLTIAELDIEPARTTVLLGPNGAGKTSLLRLISGLDGATAGTVHIGGRLVRTAKPPTDLLAYAFQQAVALRGSVRANLELALSLRGVDAQERAKRIRAIAAQLDIDPLLARDANRLSVGEAQRMNLARALSLRAPVTLLDEPFASLDAPSRAQLTDRLPLWLAEAQTTAVVVTHERDEALRIADDLVLLDAGALVASGSVHTLLHEPPNVRAAELLGFLLLEHRGEVIGTPPGALEVGSGDDHSPAFDMQVLRIVNLGARREAIGMIGDTHTRATLPAATEVAPGATCPVFMTRHIRFGRLSSRRTGAMTR